MKKSHGCAIGCGTVLLILIGCPLLFGGRLQEKKRIAALDQLRDFHFVQGETTASELLNTSYLADLEVEEKVKLDGATYLEFDHGYWQAWFLGDPVETLVIHSHWGPIRVNGFVAGSTIDPATDYPDQPELEEIIRTIEGHHRDGPQVLSVYAQHIFYALQRLRVGDKRYGFPIEYIPDQRILKGKLRELSDEEDVINGVLWNSHWQAFICTLSIPDATSAEAVIRTKLLQNGWSITQEGHFQKNQREFIRISPINQGLILLGHVGKQKTWAEEHLWPKFNQALEVLREDPTNRNPLGVPE